MFFKISNNKTLIITIILIGKYDQYGILTTLPAVVVYNRLRRSAICQISTNCDRKNMCHVLKLIVQHSGFASKAGIDTCKMFPVTGIYQSEILGI